MIRSLMLAIPASLVAVSFAAADAVVVYDKNLEEKFEAKREIVDMAKEIYGPTTVYDDGQQIPESVAKDLLPRRQLPDAARVTDVPEALAGRLPHTEPGTRWVQVGEHLIEVRPDETIVMGVYDVLS